MNNKLSGYQIGVFNRLIKCSPIPPTTDYFEHWNKVHDWVSDNVSEKDSQIDRDNYCIGCDKEFGEGEPKRIIVPPNNIPLKEMPLCDDCHAALRNWFKYGIFHTGGLLSPKAKYDLRKNQEELDNF